MPNVHNIWQGIKPSSTRFLQPKQDWVLCSLPPVAAVAMQEMGKDTRLPHSPGLGRGTARATTICILADPSYKTELSPAMSLSKSQRVLPLPSSLHPLIQV